MGVIRSMRNYSCKLTITAILIAICGTTAAVRGQEVAPGGHKPPNVDPQETERHKIFESDEWRRLSRAFDEWLSVQQIYSPEEIAAINAELRHRVEHMSPGEL